MQRKDRFAWIFFGIAILSGVIMVFSTFFFLFLTENQILIEKILIPVLKYSFISGISALIYGCSICGSSEKSSKSRSSLINENIAFAIGIVSYLAMSISIYIFDKHYPILEKLSPGLSILTICMFFGSFGFMALAYFLFYNEYIQIPEKPEVDVVESKSRLNSSN